MNILDILIVVIVGFCLIRGIFRGIIKEVTSIVGVFVGFFVAYTYYPFVATLLSHIIAKPYLNVVSFFLAFTVFFFAAGFVGVILKHIFKAVALGWADRILGATFGFMKAVLIISVLLVPLTTFLPKKSTVVKDSLLAPYVIIISEKIVAIVPTEMKQKFGENIKVLRKDWKEL